MAASNGAPDYVQGFLFTVVAGFATVLGAAFIPVLEWGGNEKQITAGALGFAAGVMLYVSFVDVLGEEAKELFENHFTDQPQASRRLNDESDIRVRIWVAVFFFLGIAVAVAMDVLMDLFHAADLSSYRNSRQIELTMSVDRLTASTEAGTTRGVNDKDVGSQSSVHSKQGESDQDKAHLSLERVSFVAFMALTLHNFPEGLATFFGGGSGSFTVPFAIAMHNIPEGAAIALPLYQSTRSWPQAVRATLIAGMAQTAGAAVGWLLIHMLQLENVSDFMYGAMYSVTAGIMVCVSIMELIPEALQASTPQFVGACVLLGFFLMECSIISLDLAKA